MESSHSLTLNEEALQKLPDSKKNIFVFEWLRFLNKIIGAANKVRLRSFFHYNILTPNSITKTMNE